MRRRITIYVVIWQFQSARRSMMLTSNPPLTQWACVFADDQTLTAAMLDRLLHHAHIAQISGERYQLKDKRNAGQTSRRNESAT